MQTTTDPIAQELQLAGQPTVVTPEMELLDKYRVSNTTQAEPEEFLLTLNGTPCFPRCDVSVLAGQAKTGKTFVTSMLMACGVSHEVLQLQRNTTEPLKVMWLDTEQSVATTKRILCDRVARMAGVETLPDEQYFVFNTRRNTPKERQQLLAMAIETYRPDICIIDGIADLTDDINSGQEANELLQQLLTLAQEHKCNITANIHQNRTGEKQNLRGWLGTVMLQKAYEVFTCERMPDNETFAVEMLFSRQHKPCQDMYYSVDENGLPYSTKKNDNTKGEKKQQKQEFYNQEYVDANPADPALPWQFRKLFAAAFGTAAMLGSDDLEHRVMALSNIKQKQYYYRVLAEAEKRRIVQKTLTRGGRIGIIILPA